MAAAIAAVVLVLASPRAGWAAAAAESSAQAQWDAVGRVVAFGDVHGAYTELRQLLRDAQVIDETGHWSAGNSHVVSLGDLIDRGPGSRQVMDLLMRLQQEAQAAGGQMHVLLGNHEAMGLLGDLRYVSAAEYASFADLESALVREAARRGWRGGRCAAPCASFDEQFPAGFFGHRAAFAADGRYGSWLLAQPVAIRINDTLFMHAGSYSSVRGMDLPQLNLRYRAVLTEYMGLSSQLQRAGLLRPEDEFWSRPRLARDRLAASSSAASLAPAVRRFEILAQDPLLSEEGPNWYRGFALCREVSEADSLALLLQQFHVARLVVGHTPTRNSRVASRFGGKVVKLDTGMNREVYRGVGAALVLLPTGLSVQYAGQAALVPVEGEGLFVAPSQLEDGRVLDALTGNDLIVNGARGADELDVGVRRDGRAIPAVLQTRDPEAVRRELAAYRLDRLLGLGIVPATVERELRGRKGLLQARPLRWLTQAEMRPGGIANPSCGNEPQFQVMYALDTLTGNEARTPRSILYDADNGMLYATSFARAFGQEKGIPSWLRKQPPAPGAELRRRLGLLNAEVLKTALGDLLDQPAREAILARRDALLALKGRSAL